VQRSPQNQQTLNKSLGLFQRGRFDKAEKLARSVLAAEPRNAELMQFVAMLCQNQEKYAEAAALCSKAVALLPHSAEAYYNLGTALMNQGHFEQAAANLRKASALASPTYDLLNNLAVTLLAIGDLAEAERSVRQAIALSPKAPLAHNTLGLILAQQMRVANAVESFKSALACGHPNPALVWDKMGLTFLDGQNIHAAVECFQKSLAHKPQSFDLLLRLAASQVITGQFAKAAGTYQSASQISPDDPAPLVGQVFAHLHEAMWVEHPQRMRTIGKLLQKPSEGIEAFSVLCLLDNPAAHLACAKRYAARFIKPGHRKHAPRTVSSAELSKQKVRIAYLSSDFKHHAVATLAVGLFEHHDHSRFETYAIAWTGDDSPLRRRIEAAFDHFIDVDGMPDEAVSQLIRDRQIDIAIDLNGHTANARPGILVGRPAPIQVNYLGYPGTMGVDWIDYLIADRCVIPPEAARFYSEKLVYLPNTYQANDNKRSAVGVAPSRRDVGLPDEGFVFACFNALNKLTPDMFAIWMRLLQQVPGSVLWLLEPGKPAEANLRKEAVAAGLDSQRLVLAPKRPIAEHMNRLQCADLFLDTLPYNAHTTASDALWAGVPVVTCPGQAFQARVAASLLRAIGLPELVATSLADYEAIALRIANNPPAHHALRDKLRRNVPTTALFDTARFTKGLETAYETMWRRWCQGLEPERIDVTDATTEDATTESAMSRM
jgi:predicted O-linked N-acetylglucosamine transferase (SPINDLY family)